MKPINTRDSLIRAGEILFATKGVESASLREITALSGQKNSTALQYHFNDRNGLLRAVIGKHYYIVEERRHCLLDEIEANQNLTTRALVGAFVRPLGAMLNDVDGGREYLQIMAELINRPDLPFRELIREGSSDSTERWRELIGGILPEIAIQRLHRRFMAIRFTHLELARRGVSPRSSDDRLFTSHLIDLVCAILEAPISDETERLLSERSLTPLQ